MLLIREFKRSKEKLLKYCEKDESILMDNLLDFKDHATSIIG